MKKLTLREMCIVAIFTALTAILAQIAIPLPFSPIPFTLQTLAIFLAANILGKRLGTMAIVVYVILGAVGVPVFANFTGGLAKVIGPTGGFILSFPVMAYIAGFAAEKDFSAPTKLAYFTVALGVCYVAGAVWLSAYTGMGLAKAFAVGVAPFVLLDFVKLGLAYSFGITIKRRLKTAGAL